MPGGFGRRRNISIGSMTNDVAAAERSFLKSTMSPSPAHLATSRRSQLLPEPPVNSTIATCGGLSRMRKDLRYRSIDVLSRVLGLVDRPFDAGRQKSTL